VVVGRSINIHFHLGQLKGEGRDAPASFVDRVSEFERALIVDAIARSGGVQTRAAALLGMSERHLRYAQEVRNRTSRRAEATPPPDLWSVSTGGSRTAEPPPQAMGGDPRFTKQQHPLTLR
jgi:hypothetical protein